MTSFLIVHFFLNGGTQLQTPQARLAELIDRVMVAGLTNGIPIKKTDINTNRSTKANRLMSTTLFQFEGSWTPLAKAMREEFAAERASQVIHYRFSRDLMFPWDKSTE